VCGFSIGFLAMLRSSKNQGCLISLLPIAIGIILIMLGATYAETHPLEELLFDPPPFVPDLTPADPNDQVALIERMLPEIDLFTGLVNANVWLIFLIPKPKSLFIIGFVLLTSVSALMPTNSPKKRKRRP